MLKLCFPDGNEYELLEVSAAQFIVNAEVKLPNFVAIRVVPIGSTAFKEYLYHSIKFNGKYYGAKLINKE